MDTEVSKTVHAEFAEAGNLLRARVGKAKGVQKSEKTPIYSLPLLMIFSFSSGDTRYNPGASSMVLPSSSKQRLKLASKVRFFSALKVVRS